MTKVRAFIIVFVAFTNYFNYAEGIPEPNPRALVSNTYQSKTSDELFIEEQLKKLSPLQLKKLTTLETKKPKYKPKYPDFNNKSPQDLPITKNTKKELPEKETKRKQSQYIPKYPELDTNPEVLTVKKSIFPKKGRVEPISQATPKGEDKPSSGFSLLSQNRSPMERVHEVVPHLPQNPNDVEWLEMIQRNDRSKTAGEISTTEATEEESSVTETTTNSVDSSEAVVKPEEKPKPKPNLFVISHPVVRKLCLMLKKEGKASDRRSFLLAPIYQYAPAIERGFPLAAPKFTPDCLMWRLRNCSGVPKFPMMTPCTYWAPMPMRTKDCVIDDERNDLSSSWVSYRPPEYNETHCPCKWPCTKYFDPIQRCRINKTEDAQDHFDDFDLHGRSMSGTSLQVPHFKALQLCRGIRDFINTRSPVTIDSIPIRIQSISGKTIPKDDECTSWRFIPCNSPEANLTLEDSIINSGENLDYPDDDGPPTPSPSPGDDDPSMPGPSPPPGDEDGDPPTPGPSPGENDDGEKPTEEPSDDETTTEGTGDDEKPTDAPGDDEETTTESSSVDEMTTEETNEDEATTEQPITDPNKGPKGRWVKTQPKKNEDKSKPKIRKRQAPVDETSFQPKCDVWEKVKEKHCPHESPAKSKSLSSRSSSLSQKLPPCPGGFPCYLAKRPKRSPGPVVGKTGRNAIKPKSKSGKEIKKKGRTMSDSSGGWDMSKMEKGPGCNCDWPCVPFFDSINKCYSEDGNLLVDSAGKPVVLPKRFSRNQKQLVQCLSYLDRDDIDCNIRKG